MTQASDIVACARGWVGTKFHHQGRLKKTASHKGGVDCLGLLVGVAQELKLTRNDQLLAMNDERDYGHVPNGEKLRGKLAHLLTPIVLDAIQPGDVALMELFGNPQHLAIIADGRQDLHLIHAYAQARGVVEHRLDEGWRKKMIAAFRFVD